MAFAMMVNGRRQELTIVRRRPHLVVSIDGREHVVSIVGGDVDGRQVIEIDGEAAHFARARARDQVIVRYKGANFETSLADPFENIAGGAVGQDQIKAPMPGAILSLHGLVGDSVKRGETIVTIESMKLQMALTAPRDGVIAEFLKKEGETFDKGEIVARLEKIAAEVRSDAQD